MGVCQSPHSVFLCILQIYRNMCAFQRVTHSFLGIAVVLPIIQIIQSWMHMHTDPPTHTHTHWHTQEYNPDQQCVWLQAAALPLSPDASHLFLISVNTVFSLPTPKNSVPFVLSERPSGEPNIYYSAAPNASCLPFK